MVNLKERIIKHFDKVTNQPYISIGVEQEFFLLFSNNRPVDHLTSQEFLQRLNLFSILTTAIDDNIGEYIENAKDIKGNVIKYDHHPFLFEIETIPVRNTYELQLILHEAFRDIYEAASMLNLQISFDPILSISTDEPDTYSELQFRKNLINYRRKLFQYRGEQPDEALCNYASGIIATQVHIGGIPFAKYNQVIGKLYQVESDIMNWAAGHIKSRLPANDVFLHRNNVYKNTFKNCPLVCFPSFEWTTTNWLDALCDTPLYGMEQSSFCARTVKQVPFLDTIDEVEFLYLVRDLQWIKPHRQGTIEFRSIPAMPDVSSIIELCKIRLERVKAVL